MANSFARGSFACVPFAVGGTPVEVLPADPSGSYRGQLYGCAVQNVGGFDCYLNGTNEVSASNGWKLPAGETLPTAIATSLARGPIWAVADGGTTSLRVLSIRSGS